MMQRIRILLSGQGQWWPTLYPIPSFMQFQTLSYCDGSARTKMQGTKKYMDRRLKTRKKPPSLFPCCCFLLFCILSPFPPEGMDYKNCSWGNCSAFSSPPPPFLRERRGGGECLFSPSRMKGDQYYFSMQTHFIASKSSRPTN